MSLANFVTLATVAETLKGLGEIHSPVMDRFYPLEERKPHPKSVIGIGEINETIRAVPVVKRGGDAIKINGASGSAAFVEAQPVIVERFVSAADANDLIGAGDLGVQAFLDSQIDYARKIVRATAEALSAQSLSGKIAWKVKDTSATYEVDFGEVGEVTPAKMWSDKTAKVGDVLETLMSLARAIRANGYGGAIKFDCGASAFQTLFNLASQIGNDTRVSARIEGETVWIGAYEISLNDSQYYNPATASFKPAVAPGAVLAWDKSAGFPFRYLAVDNVKAEFAALPIFVNAYELPNGSGWTIRSESKPFPIPVVKAMAKATVIS
jgi:hypothetical protein